MYLAQCVLFAYYTWSAKAFFCSLAPASRAINIFHGLHSFCHLQEDRPFFNSSHLSVLLSQFNIQIFWPKSLSITFWKPGTFWANKTDGLKMGFKTPVPPTLRPWNNLSPVLIKERNQNSSLTCCQNIYLAVESRSRTLLSRCIGELQQFNIWG